MTKQAFLAQLRKGLSGLPQGDIEERVSFYSEMIDDRMEEGLSEEEAVRQIGDVEEIIAQIVADTPFAKLVKEKIKPKKGMSGWEVALLVLGFPLWLPLLIAAFAVVLSIYISLWAVIISLWAVFASLAACVIGGVAAVIVFAISGNGPIGAAMLAAGIVCAGLSIFAFYGCKAATKGIWILTKKMAIWMKRCFIKKEEA